MGKHRLIEGRWYLPATSTVFICQNGVAWCSKRGMVGGDGDRNVEIGAAWPEDGYAW